MRRLKTCGAAIVAVLALTALGAITASTASAALPEFLPASGTFTSTSGAGTLEEGGAPAIECTADTDKGEITGAKTATVSIEFTGCAALKIAGAHSLGDKEKVILTGGTGTLCYLNEAKKEVGVAIKIAPLHIEVAGKLLEVTGTVVGQVKPVNEGKKTTGEIILTQSKGKQTFKECGKVGKLELLTSENEGTAKESGEQTTDKETFKEATEVMA